MLKKRKHIHMFISIGCLLMATACTDDTKTTTNNNTGITKSEASEKMASDTNAPDYCEQQGWYNDGTCDDFCRKLDAQDCNTCDNTAPCAAGKTCQRAQGQCSAQGTCVDSPMACDQNIDEVCGCDDITYNNSCAANAAGVSVKSAGKCPVNDTCDDAQCGPQPQDPNFICGDGVTMAGPTGRCLKTEDTQSCAWEIIECPMDTSPSCGGPLNVKCGPKQYCDIGQNQCAVSNAKGKCIDLPEECADEQNPVCGCDNKTYPSACHAAQANVSVSTSGACPDNATSCSYNIKNLKTTCADGFVCYTIAPEPKCDQDVNYMGECLQPPTNCSKDINYVCGCDGITYSNACNAARHGKSVHYAGKCKSSSNTCGGRLGTKCGSSTYCAKSPGQCNPTTEGTCESPPVICNKLLAYVCGCDGNTYDNSCFAAKSGTNVAYDGKCKTLSGCTKDANCNVGQFCKFSTNTCGNKARTGTCTNVPKACLGNDTPVCGCNNKTYRNECESEQAKVSLKSNKKCNGF